MPKGRRAKQKKVALAPAVIKKQEDKKVANPLFEKRPKNSVIIQDIQPKRDLTHFNKWPPDIRLQRQRAILHKRLKAPPTINQFTQALHRLTDQRQEKQQRLLTQAERKLSAKGTSPLRGRLSF